MELKEQNHAYWEWRAEGYSAYNQQELEDIRKKKWKEELSNVIGQQLPGKKIEELKIMDVGTGPGFFARILCELGAQVTAVDFSGEMLEEAKKNAGDYADQINWVCEDVQELSFEENSFDMLVTRNVTWNLPDPKKAYECWFKVLRSDGILVNYDANWYQYLFDQKKKEEYDADRDRAKEHEVDDSNVGDGFDVMEDIARKIPLGKKERPAWDMGVMDQVGYCDIRIDTEVWRQVYSEEELINWASTPMFRITGKKLLKEERILRYWTERSSSFLTQRRAELHDPISGRWMNDINDVIPQGRKLKILDVGCGTGYFSILLAREGHEVIGVDLTPGMIEGARTLALEENTDCSFRIMDAQALDFESESFDVVISRNLAWTLPNPYKAYREWIRVLKKDGILLNFDADYGREDSEDMSQLPDKHAHYMIGHYMLQENNAIKRQLPISYQRRPYWDVAILADLGVEKFQIDMGISKRIYIKKDEFYNPTPLFKLCVTK